MTEPKPRYKVAEIALDEDGTMWLNYVGTHPDQGGPSYRWGSLGLKSTANLGDFIDHIFSRELPTWLEQIRKKSNKPGAES